MLAAPEVLPKMTLTLPSLEVTSIGQYHCNDLHKSVHIRLAHDSDVQSTIALLGRAARPHPLAWHVRLQGLDEQVGAAIEGCCCVATATAQCRRCSCRRLCGDSNSTVPVPLVCTAGVPSSCRLCSLPWCPACCWPCPATCPGAEHCLRWPSAGGTQALQAAPGIPHWQRRRH